MDWSQISQNLANLPNNPLFNFGLGILSTPYQRTPVSFGQVLGNGVAQMDYARQMQAKQQQADMQAKMLQLKYNEAQRADDADTQQRAAAAQLAQNLGPDASPYEKYLAQYDPAGYARLQAQKAAQSKPLFDEKDGGFIDPQTHAFTPVTIGSGVPVPASVPRVGIPQAPGYQANVTGTNGQRVSFNFPPGTPPQVIAAARADAVARGDIAPSAMGSPTSAAQPNPAQPSAPMTLAAWRPAHAPAQGTLPAGYEWNADHTGAVRIPGLPPGTGKNDVVQQREQQIAEQNAWRAQHGMEPLDTSQQAAIIQTGQMPLLDHDAAYRAAWDYLTQGKGAMERWYGAQGPATQAQIVNMASKIASEAGVSEADIQSGRGRNKALQSSLTNIRKQNDVITSESDAMHENMQVALNIMARLGNTNYPTMNALKNALAKQYGNTAVTDLNVALNAVQTNYARIQSRATGAAGTPVGELQHTREIMNGDFAPSQLRGVFDTIDKDSSNVLSSNSNRESVITGLMGQFGTHANSNITGNGGMQASIPPQAILYLKSHPATRAQFDEQSGATAASGWSIQKVQ